jgi:hypothetical protein
VMILGRCRGRSSESRVEAEEVDDDDDEAAVGDAGEGASHGGGIANYAMGRRPCRPPRQTPSGSTTVDSGVVIRGGCDG